MKTPMRTIHAASEEIHSGRLKAIDLLQECLTRIEQLEPLVHAWVLVDQNLARAEAIRCDEEIAAGKWRGPLHGIPIGIKDIIDVFDWPTAAGSRLWAASVARQDAGVIVGLRQAGAVLVGKTVTTQYASFDPPPTRNPWNLQHTPGGSSSGSAAAVACGMCLAALASQTGGSITRPAAYCGVASFKPSYGRISTQGVVPLAHSMDHIGAMAPSVRDLGLVFAALADPGEYRADTRQTYPFQGGEIPRLGRLRGLFESQAEPGVLDMMDRAEEKLRRGGAEIVEVGLPPAFAEVVARHHTVMAVEAAQFHGERLSRHPEDYAPNIRRLLEEGLACSAVEYARCKQHQLDLAQQIIPCLRQIDALVTPASTGPAPDLSTTGKPTFNSPWSYLGLPTVSLPVERTDEGLPLGIQLIGARQREEHLFTVAAWCEDQLDWPLQMPVFKT